MATELGQAYVQIMPSAKGITGSIKKTLDPESSSAGTSAGSNIASFMKKAITVAAIGKFIGSALTAGGELQQSLGGVETLFKDNADKVKKYANEAYKTAGLSANAYMENVTSFSASLLQSLGGDTEKAADKANTAMIDMADNSNKMGTSMESIQNAYKGFAKSNYTMLDNLSLGYGGTKGEMERLLADATKLTGVKYDISNLADVYDAIHAVQGELGITGTTALESAKTLSGSLASMKGAFTNFLGSLSLGQDIKPSLQALAQTVSTFLIGNLLPMVWNIIKALPSALITFVQEAAPYFMEAGGQMINQIATGITTSIPLFLETMALLMSKAITWIKEQLPLMLQEGVEFISNFATGIFNGLPGVIGSMGEILNNALKAIFEFIPTILNSGMELISNLAKGIWDNMPTIIESITNVIGGLLDTIIEKYPEYLKKGWEIIGKMAMGIWNNLPQIITTMGNLLIKVIGTISQRLPEFLQKGIELIGQLAFGIIKAIPGIVAKIPSVIAALVRAFSGLVGEFAGVGLNLVKGLWNGISNATGWILDKIKGFGKSVLNGIKGIFGIKSPSTVFRDEVGKNLALGLGEGFTDEMGSVTKDMSSLADDALNSFNIGNPLSTVMNGLKTNPLNVAYNTLGSEEFRQNGNIIIEKMEVRDDTDIQKIARELDNLRNRKLRGSLA